LRALLINKADAINIHKAKIAAAEYRNALHYLQPATRGWKTGAYTASALTGEGIDIYGVLLKVLKNKQKKAEF
jgi:LAO/AO transport system kinase